MVFAHIHALAPSSPPGLTFSGRNPGALSESALALVPRSCPPHHLAPASPPGHQCPWLCTCSPGPQHLPQSRPTINMSNQQSPCPRVHRRGAGRPTAGLHKKPKITTNHSNVPPGPHTQEGPASGSVHSGPKRCPNGAQRSHQAGQAHLCLKENKRPYF